MTTRTGWKMVAEAWAGRQRVESAGRGCRATVQREEGPRGEGQVWGFGKYVSDGQCDS